MGPGLPEAGSRSSRPGDGARHRLRGGRPEVRPAGLRHARRGDERLRPPHRQSGRTPHPPVVHARGRGRGPHRHLRRDDGAVPPRRARRGRTAHRRQPDRTAGTAAGTVRAHLRPVGNRPEPDGQPLGHQCPAQRVPHQGRALAGDVGQRPADRPPGAGGGGPPRADRRPQVRRGPATAAQRPPDRRDHGRLDTRAHAGGRDDRLRGRERRRRPGRQRPAVDRGSPTPGQGRLPGGPGPRTRIDEGAGPRAPLLGDTGARRPPGPGTRRTQRRGLRRPARTGHRPAPGTPRAGRDPTLAPTPFGRASPTRDPGRPSDSRLIEPFTGGRRAVRRCRPQEGDRAVVFGAGTIGIAVAVAPKSCWPRSRPWRSRAPASGRSPSTPSRWPSPSAPARLKPGPVRPPAAVVVFRPGAPSGSGVRRRPGRSRPPARCRR
ncbi:hypothetical protein OK074_1169 [Actinobacteria bacterium OK074]|nr:hypothetical protein OK074_1169 [Actinobacteria bacterium OK074]